MGCIYSRTLDLSCGEPIDETQEPSCYPLNQYRPSQIHTEATPTYDPDTVAHLRQLFEQGRHLLALPLWNHVIIPELDEHGRTEPDWYRKMIRRQIHEQNYVHSKLQPSRLHQPISELDERLRCWRSLFLFQAAYRDQLYKAQEPRANHKLQTSTIW